MSKITYRDGYKSLSQEITLDSLEYRGSKLPSWLKGSFYRNGPGLYNFESGSNYKHFFDGLALNVSFNIQDKIGYKSKFLRSKDYLNSVSANKPEFTEFGTSPRRNIFDKIISTLNPNLLFGDNASVNYLYHNKELCAIWDVPKPVSIDPITMEILKVKDYSDCLLTIVNSPHPQFDINNNSYINFGIEFLPFSSPSGFNYKIFRLLPNSWKREVIASIPVDKPAYMHSFSITENYSILVEHPFLANPFKLFTMAMTNHPLVECFEWTPKNPSRFIVVDNRSGNYKIFETDPFFIFHTINAYETDSNNIVIDLSQYDNNDIVKDLYLKNIFSKSSVSTPVGKIVRYNLNLEANSIQIEKKKSASLEMPIIHYESYNGKKYSFAYGMSKYPNHKEDFINCLVKIDMVKDSSIYWFEEGCYPQEPMFVPNPNATSEDDGINLSIVFDTKIAQSFLLFLNSKDFKEIGRAIIPQVVPFGLHTIFLK